MGKILTRLGDGSFIELTEGELMRDLEEGTEDAADRGKIPPLATEELKHLFDIFSCPFRFVSVEPGKEIILSGEGNNVKVKRVGVDEDRLQGTKIFERILGADMADIGFPDYSVKSLKNILHFERTLVEEALMVTQFPISYGFMPNLGLYTQPDGPCPNPADLMPLGKIKEAQAAYEETVEKGVEDIVHVSSAMWESGVDAITFDTTGGAGDADFLAALEATEILKKKYPDIKIIMGMAGEFILGLHGELEWHGTRLAGLYPHQQVKLAEEAGVTIFGPVCNVNSNKSAPWDIARAITFMKACCEEARIPVHVDMGMGVGGVTLHDHPPIDIVSRASKAMVEICRLDGL